jgi:tRNA 2-thiocytidine biosynthesis protein TtcA
MPAQEKALLKLAEKAVREYGLIESGDRILVAASGGKDSTAMAYILQALRPVLKIDYELVAVHIASDFDVSFGKSGIADTIRGWGIPLEEVAVPVLGRLKPGRTMNCYWCSMQRRTELLRLAMEKGFNKIALGHHLDDILETFFMNMMQKGELSTMPVRLSYSKYPVTLIRPLALAEERQIIEFARSAGFSSFTCSCEYGKASKRREARAKIAALTGGSGTVKRRIFDSFSRVKADYLSGRVERDAGGE